MTNDYKSERVSRKNVIEKVFTILDIVCQNPGIGTNEVCKKVNFAAAQYLRDMKEAGILYEEIENLPGGAMCNHYYSHKFLRDEKHDDASKS